MSFQPKRACFGKYVFEVCENVYEPAEDTFLLARNLSVKKGEKVLDMGTGCGILAVLAAEKAGQVVAVDVNPHAVACGTKNATFHGVETKVDVRLGNLFEAVRADERFDLILFNAPYLPVEQGEGESWVEKAWAGGKSGRAVIDRFIEGVQTFLAQNGRILLVQSTLSNVEETLKRFSQRELRAQIIDEEKSVFERIVLIEVSRQTSF